LIEREKSQYSITDLGKFLIESLIDIWLPFLDPSFTKKVEQKLDDVKEKKRNMDDVVKEVKKEFLELFDKFLVNKHKIISKAKNYNINYRTATTSSLCPDCNKNPMKFINLKNKRFLVCADETCKRYLSLPKKGKLKMLDSTCSLCNFNIFKISVKKNQKFYNYYLCPNCWNESFKDKSGKGFCSNCQYFKIYKDHCIKKG
jgi:ssDNA-binding Zn-finger/Zn-ribbon topoisomerase 1